MIQTPEEDARRKERIRAVHDKFDAFKRDALSSLKPGRETALVATKIDEARLWAVESATVEAA
jgi:hypothetical protein